MILDSGSGQADDLALQAVGKAVQVALINGIWVIKTALSAFLGMGNIALHDGYGLWRLSFNRQILN
ncbi:hypothetical protein BST81_17940 [Leptolyngbya sp. 'hensonii']|nr:hypothetical protein BST81_17940 [Leptolyngbya sp. 'hensonii']